MAHEFKETRGCYTKPKRPLGYIVYNGPSMINGDPIVAILTMKSSNEKTGNMAQLWILDATVAPHEAIKTGQDASVCGDCPLRGVATGTKCKGRACYVLTHNAPRAVFDAWKRGRYLDAPRDSDGGISEGLTAGRMIRLGAYGDPGALPLDVIADLTSGASGWTGYTHLWRERSDLAPYCMASVEDPFDGAEAVLAGFRTFRVRHEAWHNELARDEIVCPAETRGKKCEDCGLCCGATYKAKSIVITAHGAGKGNV